MAKAILFDLFHTLTAPEAQWSDLPWTSDLLGISRDVWYQALIANTRPRLVGEITDPVEIVRLIAHSIDRGISEAQIAKAVAFRKERFVHALTRIPASTLEALAKLKSHGKRLGLVSNCDVAEVAAWDESALRHF